MVPLGSDNNISTTGTIGGTPPIIFPPGTGHFDIYFNGQKMQWNLNTFNGTQKSAMAAIASSTSARCSAQTVITTSLSGVEETIIAIDKFSVYPNPAHNRTTLLVGTANVSLKDILVIDATGRVFPVNLKSSSTQTVELDLTSLRSGIYFIKVNIPGQVKLFKVEKL
jgi:hypothetical protein